MALITFTQTLASPAGAARPTHCGKLSAQRNQKNEPSTAARIIHPHQRSGLIDTTSSAPSFFSSAAAPRWPSRGWSDFGGSRKSGNFSRALTAEIPATVEQIVAINAVPIIAVGREEPAEARTATAVSGINCTELVLMARNVHIALVAVPGRGLRLSKSRMARKPSGVAALFKPSILAAMFI